MLKDLLEKAKVPMQKMNQWLPGAGVCYKGILGVLGDDGNVLYLDCGCGYTTCFYLVLYTKKIKTQ